MDPNGMTGRHGFSFDPDIDLQETPDAYVAKLDLPGIDKDKLDIKITNGQLVVSGERNQESDASGNGYRRMERSFGSFVKSVPVPANADAEGMKVDSANGVVTIRIPKLKEAAKSAK
jgi:HSP20 family protein